MLYIRQAVLISLLTGFVNSVFSSINLDTNVITSSAGIKRRLKVPGGQGYFSKGIPYRYWTHHTEFNHLRNGIKFGHNIR